MLQIENVSKLYESLLMSKIKAHFMLHHVTCYKKTIFQIGGYIVYDIFGHLEMYPKKCYQNIGSRKW